MTAFLFLTLLVTVGSFLLAVLPRLSEFRRKRTDFVNYMLTMSATFVGVFAAIYVADLHKSVDDQRRAEEILRASEREVRDIRSKSTMQVAVFIELGSEDNMDNVGKFIAFPEFFAASINDPVLLKQISGGGFSLLKTEWQVLTLLHAQIQAPLGGKDDTVLSLKGFCATLAYIEQLLNLERQLIEGEIDKNDIEQYHALFLADKFGYPAPPESSRQKRVYKSYAKEWERQLASTIEAIRRSKTRNDGQPGR